MSEEAPTIPRRLYYQMKNGRTHNGKIGCRVKATGKDPANHAWITVGMNRIVGSKWTSTFLNYQVEYLELRADYDEEVHGWDYDQFYVRRETFYNIRSDADLLELLRTWIGDLEELQPAANIEHPCPLSL